jgi:putative membrane-bound dehydrogenase-like protein
MRCLPVVVALLSLLTPASAKEEYLSPQQAAARMQVPDGFHVSLFAGEPDLIKPIAMTFDERGRLWVVESHSYPNWLPPGQTGSDRVLILEDKAGKGHFDSCKVFLANGTNLSGIAVGFGGVWLCAVPNLLFVPFHPGEDKPAGPAQVVLDGWDLKARHNVFNTLVWGPDGWLYGCNGILSNSLVGPPTAPRDRRVALNCGVWRYHPTKKVFEAVAHGTTNPWGLDFDELGEMFITNCVIKHIFHVIPGAHYERMFGPDLNPHCYQLMESCADHIHWAGGDWTSSRGGQGAHSDAGGGHAHAGAMIYQGDNWPASYRGKAFMGNIHGNRLNVDVLKHQGSGYVSSRGFDILMAHDSWFRPLIVQSGHDGGVFVADWHDTGECHNYDKVHPSGRIFKIVYGQPRREEVNLSRRTDTELAGLLEHKNDWFARQARRLLQERATAGNLDAAIRPILREMLARKGDASRNLQALWTLQVIGGLTEADLLPLLKHDQVAVRGWAVRLLLEDRQASPPALAALAERARGDASPRVRLALAAGLQRLPLEQRWALAAALAQHAEDATDANLPLMLWYGVEPLPEADPARAVDLAAQSRLPLVRQFLTRRLATLPHGLEAIARWLAESTDAAKQRDVLTGLHETLRGQRGVAVPGGWDRATARLSQSASAAVREKSVVLSALFGKADAAAALHALAAARQADSAARRTAVETLVEIQDPALPALLRDLLSDRPMRQSALQGLAALRAPQTPALILGIYSNLSPSEKADALATLASRREFAHALLDAVADGRLPRGDLSASIVRQLLNLKNKGLTAKIEKTWGQVRVTSQERKNQLARYLALASPAALKAADRSAGRALFVKHCSSCHQLFGEGQRIGPDLTGSQRANPEYLLTKLVDPNAVVARDYLVQVVHTRNGRTISGLAKEETANVLSLQTATQLVRVAKNDIEERTVSKQSLMPEGILATLKDGEVRDLLAYLGGPGQVPLP